jgi:hypothetical protein
MRRMLRLLSLLLVLTAGLSVGGCAVNEDDKDFFYRGWIKPTDLDREAPRRLRKGPEQPVSKLKADPIVDQ